MCKALWNHLCVGVVGGFILLSQLVSSFFHTHHKALLFRNTAQRECMVSSKTFRHQLRCPRLGLLLPKKHSRTGHESVVFGVWKYNTNVGMTAVPPETSKAWQCYSCLMWKSGKEGNRSSLHCMTRKGKLRHHKAVRSKRHKHVTPAGTLSRIMAKIFMRENSSSTKTRSQDWCLSFHSLPRRIYIFSPSKIGLASSLLHHPPSSPGKLYLSILSGFISTLYPGSFGVT